MKLKQSNSSYIIGNGKAFENDETAIEAYMEMITLFQKESGQRIFSNQTELRALSEKKWMQFKADAVADGIPSWLTSVIDSTSLDEAQRKSLDKTFTQRNLISLITCLKRDQWTHTLETHENLPNGTSKEKIPELIHLRDNENVEVIGETELTAGELKNIVAQRKVMHLHLFQKESTWFVFFFTFSDLKGEHWSDTSHVHFTSSKHGSDLAHIREEVKKIRHSIKSLHLRWTKHYQGDANGK
jgi:hypothetical protein